MTRKLLPLLLLLTTAAAPAMAEVDVAADLASRGLLMTMLLVFLGGVGVSLTPCLYPMIPITLSVIGAHSVGQKPITGFLRAFTFVLGIAVIYTIIGVVTAMIGVSIQRVLQLWYVWLFLSLFFAAMGLSMLGLFELQLPPSIAARLQGKTAGKGGYVGAFLVGLVTGVAASPCGSPVLASLAVFAAEKANDGGMGTSVLLFFCYALGIGALFMALGAFPSLIKNMPKSGGWMEDVKKFLGAVLIGIALYYLQFAFARSLMLVYWLIVVAALVAGAVIVAVRAGYRRRYPVLLRAWQATGVALAAAAVWVSVKKVPAVLAAESARKSVAQVPRVSPDAMMTEAKQLLGDDAQFAQRAKVPGAGETAAEGAAGAEVSAAGQASAPSQAAAPADAVPAGWLTDEAQAVALAKQLNRPLIVDFGADWCAACKELEHKTFSDPKVVAALADFVKLRIDATDVTDVVDALQKKYGAQSLPTVRFTDPAGKHLPQFDLKTFEKPEAFLKRLEKAKAAAEGADGE